MRQENFLILDKRNKDLIELVLFCLLDEDKLKSIKVKVKNGYVKVWIYHNISLETLNKYEDRYKEKLKELEKLM